MGYLALEKIQSCRDCLKAKSDSLIESRSPWDPQAHYTCFQSWKHRKMSVHVEMGAVSGGGGRASPGVSLKQVPCPFAALSPGHPPPPHVSLSPWTQPPCGCFSYSSLISVARTLLVGFSGCIRQTAPHSPSALQSLRTKRDAGGTIQVQ